MDKTKQENLELAISAYRIESASDVFELVKKKKEDDSKNGVNKDYFTHLPIKCINENTYIQIVGTECPDVFMVWRLERNQVDGTTKPYTAHEVNQFFRMKKIDGF